jgi:3-hydroxybutyrate dehydrogenase
MHQVNNAGIQHVAPVESFPAEKWDAIISINLSAAFHAIQAVLPSMQKKGWGRIINIASAHGKVASAGKSAYVASKHGIVGLTKVVALENANKGITANAICPGWVLTPLVQKQIDDRAKAKGISAQEEKDVSTHSQSIFILLLFLSFWSSLLSVIKQAGLPLIYFLLSLYVLSSS